MVPGFTLAHAFDAAVRTGVSVILPGKPARAAVDVRGGGPGTRETDTLALGGLVEHVHAVVLAGGSVYGLAAADAVCAALGARGMGYSTGRPDTPPSPIVPAAILFDNSNGGDKTWGAEPPFARLGRAAVAAALDAPDAVPERAEGRVGAGFGATAGLHPGGFGIATERTPHGDVTALIAANPVGSPFLPGTEVFHAWALERDGEFGGARPPADYQWSAPTDTKLSVLRAAGQSTVIGAIVTDAHLRRSDLKRLAAMAQSGIAQAVQPAHTPLDGDTVFALSVGERPCQGPVALSELGFAAARATARALSRGVWLARGKA